MLINGMSFVAWAQATREGNNNNKDSSYQTNNAALFSTSDVKPKI